MSGQVESTVRTQARVRDRSRWIMPGITHGMVEVLRLVSEWRGGVPPSITDIARQTGRRHQHVGRTARVLAGYGMLVVKPGGCGRISSVTLTERGRFALQAGAR